jgi:uncharacterized protein (DUF488 family)
MAIKKIWTVGHSNRSIDEFLQLLRNFEIKCLVDVRRYPGSAKYPHFNRDLMETRLIAHDIKYLHLQDLGGRRKPLPDSRNLAWRNDSFKGYADYMETDQFKNGFSSLIDATDEFVTAIMCSEALWWRCHRALISDLLKSLGYQVFHIMTLDKLQEHPFTQAARIVDGQLSYELGK